jgi:hypothetical protein
VWSDDGSTHQVGNYPISVFLGRLSVQYSPVVWRKKLPTKNGSLTGVGPNGYAGSDIVQSGDARISLRGPRDNANVPSDMFYGLVNYRIFVAPPALSGTLTQQGK